MAMDPRSALRVAISVPGVPRDADGLVFREPWEAQAFAMTLALYERGLFTWPEWAAALSQEIKRAQGAGDPDTGETYYSHWLAALEKIVAEKGVTTHDALHRYRDAWDHACDCTPHGQPIVLQPSDFDAVDGSSTGT
ncbi:MAG TPA: nitrile hydratase accessory protein [Rudaea sp.]|uniref:nitrile hydratase accessory protein n=1 Tax=Rudaea sp. TaxID=2136325 RepID=UPI002F928E93